VLVLDTGVILSSLDRREPTHEACRSLIESCTEAIVIPAPTLCEIDHLLHQRLGPRAMPALLRDVERGAYAVEDLAPDDLARTIELMERYADLDVGYVDAAVLTIVERLDESKLATLDRKHFGAMRPRHVEGLELLPG